MELFEAAAYCDEAGVLAGVVEAEDDGAVVPATGLEAEDDELGKMVGAALCDVLAAPSGATLTLVLPRAAGRWAWAGAGAGAAASGLGNLGAATEDVADAEAWGAGARIGDADGRLDRLLTGACDAFGVEARGRSFSDGAEDVLLVVAAAVGATTGAEVSLEVSTWSTTDVLRASRLPTTVMPIELAKSSAAKTQVSLVSRLPAPRADMKPDGPPPMPSAPPSERWMRIRPPITAQISTWAVSRMPNNMRAWSLERTGHRSEGLKTKRSP